MNDKILEIEAGMRQQPDVNGRDVHLSTQCQADGTDDPRPQSSCPGSYEEQGQQQGNNQSDHARLGSYES